MHKHVIILLAFLISFMAVAAQEVHYLDLETAVAVAKNQSPSMRLLKKQLETAGYNLKSTTSAYKTHVDLDLILPQYDANIREYQDSTGLYFYPVRQNQVASYLRISQPLPTDGSLYIRSGIQNYADYNTNDRNSQLSSSIGLRQPIEALFGFNNYQLNLKQARLNYEMSLKRLKRLELDLVYQVSQVFYRVLSGQESMNIAQMNHERQLEAYQIAQNKFEAGILKEVEALQMEVDLAEASNQYENSRTSFSASLRDFKETIGINLADSVVIENKLNYQPILIDVGQAIDLAMQNRTELREDEISVEIQEMQLKRQKAAGRISGDVLLNYNFFGVDKSSRTIPIGTSFENTWMNLMDRPGSFGVGLTASIPIIDWGENKARVQSAETILEQNRIQLENTQIGIEKEIRSLVDNIHNSLRGLQIMEKSVVVAEKSFDISRQQYANGEIDSQAMALERERLNKTYVAQLQSYISYKLGLADLMRKTYFDFEKEEPVMD